MEERIYLSISFNSFPRAEVESVISKLMEWGFDRAGMSIYMNEEIPDEDIQR